MSIRIVKRNTGEILVREGVGDEMKTAVRIRREMAGTVLSWIKEQSKQRELAMLKARLFITQRADEQPES
jgi:hypothetical protein